MVLAFDQDWVTEQMEQMVHIRGQVEAAHVQMGVQSQTIREQNIALECLREENESLKSKLLKPSNSDTVVDKLAGPSNSDDARIKEELEAQLLDVSEQLEVGEYCAVCRSINLFSFVRYTEFCAVHLLLVRQQTDPSAGRAH
eukprot:COSAG05_NODE_249_length_12903_cov_128.635505_8_plen_142_part_00